MGFMLRKPYSEIFMRLSTNYIDIIVKTAKQMLGEDVGIWLFGSRIDDTQKGGDIDLYLETNISLENRTATASRYAARLQQQLGEQRFDILIVDPETPTQAIYSIAKKTGIRL